MKLSPRQLHALKVLEQHGSERSAYPGLSLATLHSLAKRGLVDSRAGLGSMAFPTTGWKFKINWRGEDALREAAENPTESKA
jgi:hypothetical protein